MERYLLDSSAILNILEGSAEGRKAAGILRGNEVVTSIVCYCEVLNKASREKQSAAEAFLSKVPVFPVSLADGYEARKIADSCRKDGNYVPTLDCIIAATAKNNNATVVTMDDDFARMAEVRKVVI